MGGALAMFLFLTAFPYLGIDWETNKQKVSIEIEKRKKVAKKESVKVVNIIKQSKKKWTAARKQASISGIQEIYLSHKYYFRKNWQKILF